MTKQMIVWKFPLDFFPYGEVEMPMVRKFLHFEIQDEVPTVWYEVHPESASDLVIFRFIGTGNDAPHGTYRATLLQEPYVWHLYEVGLHGG